MIYKKNNFNYHFVQSLRDSETKKKALAGALSGHACRVEPNLKLRLGPRRVGAACKVQCKGSTTEGETRGSPHRTQGKENGRHGGLGATKMRLDGLQVFSEDKGRSSDGRRVVGGAQRCLYVRR